MSARRRHWMVLCASMLAWAGCDSSASGPTPPSSSPTPETAAADPQPAAVSDPAPPPQSRVVRVHAALVPVDGQVVAQLPDQTMVRVAMDRDQMRSFLRTHYPQHTLEETRNGFVVRPPSDAPDAALVMVSWRGDGYMLQIHHGAGTATPASAADGTEKAGRGVPLGQGDPRVTTPNVDRDEPEGEPTPR